MFLKSFKVNSYRSCRNTHFPLNKNLTGLIGINGSGKTNVLNALLLLRKIFERKYRYSSPRNIDSPFNTCQISAAIEHEGNTIQLKGKLKLDTDDRNNDEIIASELQWKFSNYKTKEWFYIPLEFFSSRNIESSFHFNRRIGFRFPVRSKQSIYETISLLDDKKFKKRVIPLLNEIFLFFNGINYYSATQFSDPNRCPVSIEIELEENKPKRRMRLSTDHEQFLFDLYNSKTANDKEYKRYFNVVGKNGVGLIDDFDFKTLQIPSSVAKVHSGGDIKLINYKRSLIVPIFTIDGRELSPNQLSEGTFKTLALLYYVITDKSKLLLIEEPEVCIHHGLLDSIIKLIINQSKQKQIVISTHSDFVLDHLLPENILLVKYLRSKGSTVEQLKKSMSKSDYSALRNYLKESGNLGEYWREGGLGYD